MYVCKRLEGNQWRGASFQTSRDRAGPVPAISSGFKDPLNKMSGTVLKYLPIVCGELAQ